MVLANNDAEALSMRGLALAVGRAHLPLKGGLDTEILPSHRLAVYGTRQVVVPAPEPQRKLPSEKREHTKGQPH